MRSHSVIARPAIIIFKLVVKGPVHKKNENLYFLAPAQTKLMQPILVPYEAPLRSNLQKKNIGPLVFRKLLLNGLVAFA